MQVCPKTRLKATLWKGLNKKKILKMERTQGSLRLVSIFLFKQSIFVGWRETSARQGVLKRCSEWNKAIGVAFCSTSLQKQCHKRDYTLRLTMD